MGKFIKLLRDEQGGQIIKSSVGILVFVLFIVVSVLFNNPLSLIHI